LEYLEQTALFIYNEEKVKEYQELLEHKNIELEEALSNLKNTQKQLVESEVK
jgi:hypothetical protein